MEKLPLVSVGMPVYNGEKYLDEAISSILNQTYKNIELIISDDNSNDNSIAIIQNWKIRDPRIKVILQNKNIGYPRNFNQVLKISKGKYFCWAAQDDLHENTFLEVLVNLFLQDKKLSVSMTDYRNLFEGKKYKIYQVPKKGFETREESLNYFLGSVNLSLLYALYKTEVLKKIGGHHIDFRPYFKESDFLIIFKTLLHGSLGFYNEVLFYKRDTGKFTHQWENLKNENLFKLRPKIIRYLLFPIHYLFDLTYGSYYLLSSDNNFNSKLRIELMLLRTTLRLFFVYFKNIFRGAIILFQRFL